MVRGGADRESSVATTPPSFFDSREPPLSEEDSLLGQALRCRLPLFLEFSLSCAGTFTPFHPPPLYTENE